MKRKADSIPSPATIESDPVVLGLLTAISRKLLKPGAKLGEESLAQAFGTTRIHVRQVLSYLASRGIVAQIPNRGAFVHRPSWKEAQDIFAVRGAIERAAVEAAIDNMDKAGMAALRRQLARETDRNEDDRGASLSLTAEFHLLIARIGGNTVLFEMARDITLRTSLAIATFEPPGSHDCSPDAHPGIAEMIIARDRPGAVEAMARHLDEMKARLRPDIADPPRDIGAILKEVGIVPARSQAPRRPAPAKSRTRSG